jgi:hypothetical protein
MFWRDAPPQGWSQPDWAVDGGQVTMQGEGEVWVGLTYSRCRSALLGGRSGAVKHWEATELSLQRRLNGRLVFGLTGSLGGSLGPPGQPDESTYGQ